MNPINSSSSPLLKPVIDLGSLGLDLLRDQIASSREVSISLPKNLSPHAQNLTNPSNSDSRNISIDRFTSFPLVAPNRLTVKVKTVADASMINPELRNEK